MAEVSPPGFFARLFGLKSASTPPTAAPAKQDTDHVQRFNDVAQKGPLPSYPFDPQGVDLIPPEKLIEGQESLILKIRQRANCSSDEEWRGLYMATIYEYACWVHCLPASESHHHSAPTGLFRHGLEVAYTTMNIGYKYCNDINNPPSVNRLLQGSWPFACFVAGLFHDIGKPLSDVTITGPDGAVLTAFSESVYHWATRRGYSRYYFHYNQDRHEDHKSLAAFVLGMCMRKRAAEHLDPFKDKEQNRNLMRMVIPAVQGSGSPTNLLIRFVQQADQASVSFDRRNIAANPSPDEPFIRKPTVPGRFIDALRALVESGAIVANRPDGKHWIIEDAAHFAWPAIVDDVVASVAKTDPLPTDYSLLLKALNDFNYLSVIESKDSFTSTWRVRLGLHQSKSVIDTICIRDIKNIYRRDVPASIDAEIITPTNKQSAQSQAESTEQAPTQQSQPAPPPASPESQDKKTAPKETATSTSTSPSGISSEYLKADPMPLPGASAPPAPAPKPSSPSDRSLSAPAANDPNTARQRLQTLDHGLGPYLIDIAKSLRDEPHYRQLATTLNDRLVLCFPDAVAELGMDPKDLAKKFAAAEILETNMEGGANIKKAAATLGFDRAIVLDLKHSKDILRVAGNPQLPTVAEIRKSRRLLKAQQTDSAPAPDVNDSAPAIPPPSHEPLAPCVTDQAPEDIPGHDMPPDMPPEFYEQSEPPQIDDSFPDYGQPPAPPSISPDHFPEANDREAAPVVAGDALASPEPSVPPRTVEIRSGMSVLDLLTISKPAAAPITPAPPTSGSSPVDVHARVVATVAKIRANHPDHFLDTGSGPIYVSSVHFSQNLGLSRELRQAYLTARSVRQLEHPSIGQSLAFPRDLLESNA